MKTYILRIAVQGMASSWRLTYVTAPSAERAIELAEQREIRDGYTPLAFLAENRHDAHDVASKGVWPFAVAS